MTKKKGRSKGGGPGCEQEEQDGSTDEEAANASAVVDPSLEGGAKNLQGSCEKAQATSPRCPHVGKAVNPSAIKKALKVCIICIWD